MAIKEYKTDNIHINFNIVDSDGSSGTSGQVLSRDTGGVTWVDGSGTVIGGPYLPLAGGTMTGNIIFNNNIAETWKDNAGATTRMMVLNSGNVAYIGPIDSYAGGPIFYGVSANVTYQAFSTGAVERMRIDSSGNVMIGNTAAGAKLDVRADTGYVFRTENASGNTFRIEASSGNIYTTGDLYIEDSNKIRLGAGSDLQIYHDGINSYIENETGNLTIFNKQDDGDVSFASDNGSGGTTTYFQLDGSHTQSIAWKDIHFVDGVKAKFGDYASPDLQIYHDGSNSFIKDTGTGDLYVDAATNFFVRNQANGEVWIKGTDSGVSLRYQDSQKLITTSTGVSVTGNVLASGYLAGQSSQYNPTGGGTTLATLTGSGASRTNLVISNQANNAAASAALVLATYGHDYFIKGSSSLGGSQLTLGFNTSNFLTLTSSAATFAGDVTANGNIKINTGSHLFFDGSTNATYISEDIADRLRFFVGGAEFMRFTESTADTVTIYKDTTFGTQAFATTATSSGDGSSTLTTKGYVDGLITGATIYRGAWDPSGGGYGSPDLSTVTQTSGYYYICSAAGTAEPNGTGTEPDSWSVGDWVIYNDVSGTGQWQKIDNSSVLSGAGTGQTVALWEGANSVTDSETLGNAPITVSGNNTTFAGDLTISKSTPKLIFDNLAGGGLDPSLTASGTNFTLSTSSITPLSIALDTGDATFTGNVDIGGGGAASSRFTTRGSTDDSSGYALEASNSSGASLFLVRNDGAATFAGSIDTTAVNIKVGSATHGTITSSSNSLTLNARNTGIMLFQSGGVERMRINGTNVGIGTTSPTTKLNVAGNISVSSGSYLAFIDSNIGYNKIGRNTSVGGIQITTGASATMNLLDNGNVGIGTTSPLGKLQVNEYTVASQGNQGVHGEVSIFANNGDESLFLGIKNSAYPDRGWAFNPVTNGVNSNLQIKEHGSSGVRMTIQTGGNVGIGTTNPGAKLAITQTTAAEGLRVDGASGGFALIVNGGTSYKTSLKNASVGNGYVGNTPPANGLIVEGNVGIGTTSPLNRLFVTAATAGDYAGFIENTNATNGYGLVARTAHTGTSAYAFAARAGTSDIFVVRGDGNVGIGTTSPSGILHVKGSTDDTVVYIDTNNNALGDSAKISFNDRAQVGWIDAAVTLTDGGGNKDIKLKVATGSVFVQTNNTTRLTVANGGNVGIGTTSPGKVLDVNGEARVNSILTLNRGSAASLKFSRGSDFYLGVDNSGNLNFLNNAASSLGVWENTGNVGIGTTSPQSGGGAAKWLSLNGTAAYSGGVVYTIGSTTKAYSYFESDYLKQQAQTGFGQKFIVDGTNTAITILSSGNVGIGTTIPSAKLDVKKGGEGLYFAAGGDTGNARSLQFTSSANLGSNGAMHTINAISGNGAIALATASAERMRITNAGGISFGSTGTAYGTAGQVLTSAGNASPTWTTPSSGGTIGGSIASTQLALGSGTANEIQGSSKLTFTYVSGGLGYDKFKIGDGSTGSNQVLLDINTLGTASSRGRLTLSDAGTLRGYLGITGGDTEVTLLSNANLILDSGSTDDVIITTNSGSNVGIGNTAPTYKLDVTGTGRFTSTVTATNFILSSDERLKDNIKNIDNDHIDVDWKNFELKSEPGIKRSGVIAQELEEKHPEFVRTDKEGLKSVAYIDLLIAKIAELEARLEKSGI